MVKTLPGWLMVLAIASLGILVYSNTFNASFQFDDETSITRNDHIQRLANIPAIWKFWPTRFLTYFSFALNFHFWKFDVFGYHAVNLFVHIASGLCVFWLVSLLFKTPALKTEAFAGRGPWVAFFAGLIFISHPVQTQGVTYITQRAVSMASLFYLAGLGFYVKSRLGEKEDAFVAWLWHKGALALALAAVFTKEMTLTMPFAIWMIEKFFLEPGKKPLWKRLLPFFAVVLVIPLTMALARSVDFAGMRRLGEPIPNISPYAYLMTQFRVMVTYLRLLFVPLRQNLDYDYQVYTSLFQGPVFLSLLFLCAVLVLAGRLRRRYRLVSFGVFFFFLALLPESSILPIRDVIFEHRLYLPLLGFSIFLPEVFVHAFGRRDMRIAIVALALVVGWNSFLAYQRNFVWKDQETMWNDSIKKAPKKSRGYKGLGFEFEKAGEIDRAMAEYDKALALNPEFDEVYYNKANIYASQEKYDLAFENYDRAIELNPSYAMAYHNRALVYAILEQNDKAIQDLNKAIELQPDYKLAFRNRGYYYVKKGDPERSLEDYDMAIKLDPGYDVALSERGAAYAAMGDYGRAAKDYELAIRLNYRTPDIYNNLGFAYYSMGRFDEAIRNLTTAIQMKPDFVVAYHNRGQAYGMKGETGPALQDFDKVIELESRYFLAYRNRGIVRAAMGRKDLALADCSKAIEVNPSYALAYVDRAALYFEMGDCPRAREDARQAENLGLKPDENFARVLLDKCGAA